MSHGVRLAAFGLGGVLLLSSVGCALPVIEGAKAAHVATEGVYEEITPIAAGVLAKYKGYKVGECSRKAVLVPLDTKPADKAEIQKQIDEEIQMAEEVVAILPERMNEYAVDDAMLQLNATPALVVSVRDVRVTKKHGAMATAFPRVAIESKVTLTDGATGRVLGVATVSGHTSSLVLGDARQLANFICRGAALWIHESRLRDAGR